LRDFGDRLDGGYFGVKLWLGDLAPVRLSFHVRTEEMRFLFSDFTHKRIPRNAIIADGLGENVGPHHMYAAYNAAFFDKSGNLIAANGMPSGGSAERGVTYISCRMPIPSGLHEQVASYKVAFYERNNPIGAAPPASTFQITRHVNGAPGVKLSWPAWKSDGELRPNREKPSESSPFPVDAQGQWKAETRKCGCVLKKAEFSIEKIDELPAIEIGKGLRMKGMFHFVVNSDNEIEPWYCFRNTAEVTLFTQVYFAFFDKYDSLVAARAVEGEVGPKRAYPWVAVNGVELDLANGYKTCGQHAPIPLGLDQSVVTCRITMYEAEAPIGQVKVPAKATEGKSN
jgi:hypothetical protein